MPQRAEESIGGAPPQRRTPTTCLMLFPHPFLDLANRRSGRVRAGALLHCLDEPEHPVGILDHVEGGGRAAAGKLAAAPELPGAEDDRAGPLGFLAKID